MDFINIEEELKARKFKKEVEREFEEYFEFKGYGLIEPDTFLNYDDYLLSNVRRDTSKTVKVISGNSKIYLLRPDITLNLLGKIFSKWKGEPPLKIYYNSKIYTNSHHKHITQHNQIGVESLGEEVMKADQEIFEMAFHLLDSLNTPYVLELGSSIYLDAYLRDLQLEREDEEKVLNLIENKNRDELAGLLSSLGIEGLFENILDLEGDMESVIDKARHLYANEEMLSALDYLESLVAFFKERQWLDRIHLDLSMVADLDYYDGIIFKGFSEGIPKKLISGGRYDKLTEKFGNRVPAVGFMMDMDAAMQLRYKEGK